MTEAADSYLDEWRAARPLRDLLIRFMPVGERGLPLLLCLQSELLGTIYAVDPVPAAARLDWWARELARFGSPGAEHPLSRALAADARAARVPASWWPKTAEDVRAALEAPASARFADQLAAAEAGSETLARIESTFLYGPGADFARTRRLQAVQQLIIALLHAPRRAGGGALPLPLAALARHALDRAALAQPGPARRAAFAEQCVLLAEALDAKPLPQGPVAGFRLAEAVHDARALRRAAGAEEPLSELQFRRRGLTPGDAWRSWKAMRAGPATSP